MRKANVCECGSNKEKEVIIGGITITVYREDGYTVKDEIEYEKTDEYSKWYCTDCGKEIEIKQTEA